MIPEIDRQKRIALSARLDHDVLQSGAFSDAWVMGHEWPRAESARWRDGYFRSTKKSELPKTVPNEAFLEYVKRMGTEYDRVKEASRAGVPCHEVENYPSAFSELWRTVFRFFPKGRETPFIRAKSIEGALGSAAGEGPFAGVGALAAYYGSTGEAIRAHFYGFGHPWFAHIRRTFEVGENGTVMLPDDHPDVQRLREGIRGVHRKHRDMDAILDSRRRFWPALDEEGITPPPAAGDSASQEGRPWWRFLWPLGWRQKRVLDDAPARDLLGLREVGDEVRMPCDPRFAPLLRTFHDFCREQETVVRTEKERFADALLAAEERLRGQQQQLRQIHDGGSDPGSDAASWAATLQACAEARARARRFLDGLETDSN